MSRFLIVCLIPLVACTTPPDGTFGAATFAIDAASQPATAMATPVFIYDNDGDGHLGYDVAVYSGADIPAGSPCGGSYRATQFVELDIVTLQDGQRADLSPETLPVLAQQEDEAATHTHDYVYFDSTTLTLASDYFGPTMGTMTITNYDGSYIDATFDVTGYAFQDRYEGDDSTSYVEFTGSMHAGICAGN